MRATVIAGRCERYKSKRKRRNGSLVVQHSGTHGIKNCAAHSYGRSNDAMHRSHSLALEPARVRHTYHSITAQACPIQCRIMYEPAWKEKEHK
jgi:hypothetical protein